MLSSVPGIGDILAVTIRYEIDEIGRFVSGGKLCSYAGLVPSTYSSGNRTYQGKITKQGNKWLRGKEAKTCLKEAPRLKKSLSASLRQH